MYVIDDISLQQSDSTFTPSAIKFINGKDTTTYLTQFHTAGLSKALIDSQQNLGGDTLLAVDTFKHFLPSNDTFRGSRLRAQTLAGVLAIPSPPSFKTKNPRLVASTTTYAPAILSPPVALMSKQTKTSPPGPNSSARTPSMVTLSPPSSAKTYPTRSSTTKPSVSISTAHPSPPHHPSFIPLKTSFFSPTASAPPLLRLRRLR